VLTKKQEINTLPDTGKKRQLINPKENFHNVTPKSKAFIESWFKDLAGCKPLINLGKRVDTLNFIFFFSQCNTIILKFEKIFKSIGADI